jgi:hypothetical protein
MAVQSTELKGRRLNRHQRSVKANREARDGKKELYATYEQMGLTDTPYTKALLHRIYRKRIYIRNQTGEDEG